MLRIKGYPEVDALYMHMSDLAVSYSKELSESIVADFAEDGTLVGIGVHHVSDLLQTNSAETVNVQANEFGPDIHPVVLMERLHSAA